VGRTQHTLLALKVFGTRLAVVTDHEVLCWDLETGKHIQRRNFQKSVAERAFFWEVGGDSRIVVGFCSSFSKDLIVCYQVDTLEILFCHETPKLMAAASLENDIVVSWLVGELLEGGLAVLNMKGDILYTGRWEDYHADSSVLLLHAYMSSQRKELIAELADIL
jgi:hypothetical protein